MTLPVAPCRARYMGHVPCRVRTAASGPVRDSAPARAAGCAAASAPQPAQRRVQRPVVLGQARHPPGEPLDRRSTVARCRPAAHRLRPARPAAFRSRSDCSDNRCKTVINCRYGSSMWLPYSLDSFTASCPPTVQDGCSSESAGYNRGCIDRAEFGPEAAHVCMSRAIPGRRRAQAGRRTPFRVQSGRGFHWTLPDNRCSGRRRPSGTSSPMLSALPVQRPHGLPGSGVQVESAGRGFPAAHRRRRDLDQIRELGHRTSATLAQVGDHLARRYESCGLDGEVGWRRAPTGVSRGGRSIGERLLDRAG